MLSYEAGDVEKDSAEDLASIFKKYDVVVGCSGMEGSTGAQLKLTRAAIAAELKRFIPWQFGVDHDILGRNSGQRLFDEQLDVRAALEAQDRVKWIIISTGIFMRFLVNDFFGVVSRDRKTVRALGSWSNTVTVTDVDDIGRMTTEVVWNGYTLRNKVGFVAGHTIWYNELSTVVDDIQGSSVNKVEWVVPQLKEELSKDPENSIKRYRVVFAGGTDVSWDKSKP